MPSVIAISPDRASDVDYGVLCGTCPDALGEHVAQYAVEYGVIDADDEPDGARLFTCRDALGETYADAEARNRSFVPPFVSPLPSSSSLPVPVCPWCGAEYHACETTFRGLCVQMPVSA